MRSLEQIVAENGNDPRPAMDTHNLTGRVDPLEQARELFFRAKRQGDEDFESGRYAPV